MDQGWNICIIGIFFIRIFFSCLVFWCLGWVLSAVALFSFCDSSLVVDLCLKVPLDFNFNLLVYFGKGFWIQVNRVWFIGGMWEELQRYPLKTHYRFYYSQLSWAQQPASVVVLVFQSSGEDDHCICYTVFLQLYSIVGYGPEPLTCLVLRPEGNPKLFQF